MRSNFFSLQQVAKAQIPYCWPWLGSLAVSLAQIFNV